MNIAVRAVANHACMRARPDCTHSRMMTSISTTRVVWNVGLAGLSAPNQEWRSFGPIHAGDSACNSDMDETCDREIADMAKVAAVRDNRQQTGRLSTGCRSS